MPPQPAPCTTTVILRIVRPVEVVSETTVGREHFDGEKRGAVALGAANKQNEGPLRDSAGRPVMANAEQVR